MAGTDAIGGDTPAPEQPAAAVPDTAVVPLTDEPMSGERAAEVSDAILRDMGIRTDQAEGATTQPADGGTANPTSADDAGAGAPANQQTPGSREPNANASGTPGGQQAWMTRLPEAVQANLSQYDEGTQSKLRELAESGLRLDDYTRKTQAVKRTEAENKELRKRADLLDNLVAKIAAQNGQAPAADPDDAPPKIAELMAESDPEAFAEGLEKFIGHAVQKQQEETRAASPEARADLVNSAAAQIREALGDNISNEQWDEACVAFEENCAAFGEEWWDVDPHRLPGLLRPHIRAVLAKGGTTPQAAAAEGEGGAPASEPPTAPSDTGTSTPALGSGARAASMTQGMGGGTAPTAAAKDPSVGSEDAEEAAYRKTMARFNIPNEAALRKLRQAGT